MPFFSKVFKILIFITKFKFSVKKCTQMSINKPFIGSVDLDFKKVLSTFTLSKLYITLACMESIKETVIPRDSLSQRRVTLMPLFTGHLWSGTRVHYFLILFIGTNSPRDVVSFQLVSSFLSVTKK